MTDTGHSFLAYFKRATSPLVVLALLCERPMYVYEISSAMDARSDGKFKLSLLYPVIYRLEEQGFAVLSSTKIIDGRARSYYSITPAGREYLHTSLAEYDMMDKTMRLLTGGVTDE